MDPIAKYSMLWVLGAPAAILLALLISAIYIALLSRKDRLKSRLAPAFRIAGGAGIAAALLFIFLALLSSFLIHREIESLRADGATVDVTRGTATADYRRVTYTPTRNAPPAYRNIGSMQFSIVELNLSGYLLIPLAIAVVTFLVAVVTNYLAVLIFRRKAEPQGFQVLPAPPSRP